MLRHVLTEPLVTGYSKVHSWLLPVFAVGLGAPRWCQMFWGTSGIALYIPWGGAAGPYMWVSPQDPPHHSLRYILTTHPSQWYGSLVVARCTRRHPRCRFGNDSPSDTFTSPCVCYVGWCSNVGVCGGHHRKSYCS